MFDIENEFISQLHQSREVLSSKYNLGDLEEKYLAFFDEVYKKKNTKALMGKDAKDFF